MPELKLGRCLVTGASSPLGSALTRRLVECDATVAVMVRGTSSLRRVANVRDRIQLIEGTLEAPAQAAKQIEDFGPTTVFHLAWYGSGRLARNDPAQIDVNVPGSLELLKIVLRAGAKSWIGLGSQAEYGVQGGPFREDMTPAPTNAYGLAKLSVGELSGVRCRIAAVRSVWLRLFATYGPADNEDRLIPYLIRTLLAGGNPKLTAGTQRWDYLYVDDAAEAVIATARSAVSGVFNLASGSAWTVGRIAGFLRDEIRPFARLEYGVESPSSLEANISRLVEATGWTPATQLEAGLRRTIDFYRSDVAKNASMCRGTESSSSSRGSAQC